MWRRAFGDEVGRAGPQESVKMDEEERMRSYGAMGSKVMW